MKKLSVVLLVVFALVSCNGEKKATPPDDLISLDKMAVVMADIHQAEGIISTRELTKDSSLLVFAEVKKQLFEKRGITNQQFKDSYNWYTSQVESYKELYTIVVDTLNARTSEGKIPQ